MIKTNTILAVLTLLVATSCAASHQKQVMEEMKHPINCATAEGDIRVLEQEKVHVAQQILEGVTAIVPAGAVIGILSGTEVTKLKVGIGEYNRMIDARIAAIKEHCNIE